MHVKPFTIEHRLAVFLITNVTAKLRRKRKRIIYGYEHGIIILGNICATCSRRYIYICTYIYTTQLMSGMDLYIRQEEIFNSRRNPMMIYSAMFRTVQYEI